MSDTTRTPPASEGTSSAGLAHERETAAAGVPEQRGAAQAEERAQQQAQERPPVVGAEQIARLLGRDLPTDEQRRIIEAPLEPVLVVAGAGWARREVRVTAGLTLRVPEGAAPGRYETVLTITALG